MSGRRLSTCSGAIAGDPNTAVQFDGVDDYATTPPTIFDDVSIEFWFKSTQGIGAASWNLGAGMVTTDENPAKDFGVSLTADGRVAAGVATNGSIESISRWADTTTEAGTKLSSPV